MWNDARQQISYQTIRSAFGKTRQYLVTALLSLLALCAMLTPSVAPAATLSSIAVTPANPTLTIGQTQQITATGTFSDGTVQTLQGQPTAIAAGIYHTCAVLTSGAVQ